jgi:hypothetical protein
MSRFEEKARILSSAWQSLFGVLPSFVAMVNAMSVAEFETRMGDAWPGENNWGAVMKRGLTKDEAALLRQNGVSAAGGADAVAKARTLLIAGPNEALHRDSSPEFGPYFAWFWSFETPEQAAKKFLDVLVRARPGVRKIIDHATPDELARAMYESFYYAGFHKDDPEANVRDYARGIRRTRAAIEAALRDLAPPPPPPAVIASAMPPPDLATVGLAIAVICILVFTRSRWPR